MKIMDTIILAIQELLTVLSILIVVPIKGIPLLIYAYLKQGWEMLTWLI